eukprot:6213845-Pleurochrysis_carterae.AAC.1
MAQALGRHTGQARTPQSCCVRHRELGRRSSCSLATRDDIRCGTGAPRRMYSHSAELSGRPRNP